MSQSTITAEGGTITLSTAPDGEITASSADFAVYVVQQVEGGGGGVTEYDTVSDLIAASLVPGFAVGYYEVPGVWITYWDGVIFSPSLPNPTTTTSQFRPASGLIAGAGFLVGTGTSTIAVLANETIIAPFSTAITLTVDRVRLAVTSAGTNARILVFGSAPETNRPVDLIYQSDEITVSSTGNFGVDVDWTLTAGRTYWIGVWVQSNTTFRTFLPSSFPWLSAGFSGSSVVAYFSLLRSQDWADGTANQWVYSDTHHSTKIPVLVGLEIA